MWLSCGGLCAAVLSLGGIFLYLDPQVPAAETYRNVQLETPLRIYSEDGALLAEFGERRLIPLTLKQVPQQFINALLDTEDKRFYEHSGIDFISLANDVVGLVGTLIMDGELGPGASTITMQLARNVSFTLERRFLRKFKEMLLALKIERELSKDEILELYINLVPFGKRAYGAQAAALTYYGKSLDELNLPQLAMLAGIPQAPSAGNPINGPERALRRRNVVLSLMRDQESITESEFRTALTAPISASVYARELDVGAPYPAEWARQLASASLDDLYKGGYEIYTTINSSMQAAAIKAVRKGLASYDKQHGYRGAEAQISDDLITALNETSTFLTDELRDELLAVLETYKIFGGLLPAIVLSASSEAVEVLGMDGQRISLALSDNGWIRPYVNVDLRGPMPTDFATVLTPGDVVRVERLPGPTSNSENASEQESDANTAENAETEAAQDPEEGTPAEIKEQPQIDAWRLAQLPEIQGALVSLDPGNGKVRSLVGGSDFYRNQYNHALQAARQPGSGFKPFVYSAAINKGVTPADMFMDAPLVFDDENLESQYRPDNDNNRYNGPTRLREALYRSINLVSMRVLLEVGAGNVLDHVSRFGFSVRNFPRNTQLAIGGGTMAVTPIDMARAYAVLANGGYLIEPYLIETIKNAQGETIYQANQPFVCPDCATVDVPADGELFEAEPASLSELLNSQASAQNNAGQVLDGLDPDFKESDLIAKNLATDDLSAANGQSGPDTVAPGNATETPSNNPTDAADSTGTADDLDPNGNSVPGALQMTPIYAPQVVDPRNAFIMNSMLRDVIRRGTGGRARTLGRQDLAGKTGTTNDAADTWFNGFSPALVTTVWVGFSNHEPLGARAYGSNTPLPIWIEFMETALDGVEEIQLPQPPGVVSLKIDPTTGRRAVRNQQGAVFEYFLQEHTPRAEQRQPQTEDPVKAIDLF